MTKDEALRMALAALEEPREHIAKHRRLEAINAIKEALAQPEQEPVAVDCCANCLRPKHEHMGGYCPNPYTTVWHAWDYPFTPDATPPQRKPLTDEQWQEIAAITGCLRIEKRGRDAILRVLEEAAHGIKE